MMGSWALTAVVSMSVIIGGLLGALIVRRRHQAQQIVAAVNGTTITQGQFFGRLQKASGPATLHAMVEEELRLQFAKKYNVLPTDADVEAQLAKLQAQPGFNEQLAASGESLQDMRRTILLQLAQANVVAKDISVTDDEARSYYQTQSNPANPRAPYYRPPVSRIQAVIARSHDTILEARKDLQNGLPFELVAKKYSEDPSGKSGGVFPPIARNNSGLSKIPGFDAYVFAMAVGQRSEPVKFGGAWWIIRCNDKTAAKTVPFDTVKDECRLGARVAKGMKLHGKDVEDRFKQFQQAANIQAFWRQYENAVH